MKVTLVGTIENVEMYEGKNGFGANVTMSEVIDKRRQLVTFTAKDKKQAELLENNLQEEAAVQIILTQSNFGLRLGEIVDIGLVS